MLFVKKCELFSWGPEKWIYQSSKHDRAMLDVDFCTLYKLFMVCYNTENVHINGYVCYHYFLLEFFG